ncbi:putative p-aminobenzoate synthase component I [Novosphingobium resinovorum]|uniref:Putative p-aminobenzoate synthase component I n=1 Tax=Novosphingobium resinovorum TaxID=158500 RepID=A0A031K4M2_9SPHN|nr:MULTISPECIES: aminodeoxychorismate synthase component I [Novosphingobium]EZP83963.1 putative p-aminobenzoate synthase component I [Novosphingobium resinovorum]
MARPPHPTPFVLLEDLDAGTARLFETPLAAIGAVEEGEVAAALARADALAAEGHAVAGWIGYEAGHALEARLGGHQRAGDRRLLALFAFERCTEMATESVDGWLAGRAAGGAALSPLVPAIDFSRYAAGFVRVKEAIVAGDIYQANLTFPLRGTWRGDPVALYRAIRPEAKARYAALIFDGSEWLLSFSPELFFEVEGRDIRARPMKGTRPRGSDAESDRRNAEELAASAKDRAENLMIVDLMRNDLSRIGVPGSVRVDALFRIETYPTVFQMTTGVSARLTAPPTLSGLIGALFPCGSITGAPKIRAMEIIRDVEQWDRGPYCGAIGALRPGASDTGDVATSSRFNVAIRTLRLRPDRSGAAGTAEFGVGSGIVADSVLEDEWAECLLKAKFVARAAARLTSEPVSA